MTEKESLGARLQFLRQQKGLTQAELASHIFVSRETVKDWENNRYEPSCEILVELSVFYKVSTDYILGVRNTRIINMDHLSDEQFEFIAQLVHSMQKKDRENPSHSIPQSKADYQKNPLIR